MDAERIAVISCGYEPEQLSFENYDLDRRAVDIAAFNAQGDHSIAWWPMYGDVEAGDMVLLRLAKHRNVVISPEVIHRAARYSNCEPRMPTHPGVVEGATEWIFERGYQGLGLIMPELFDHGPGIVQGTVGHIVFFPRWLDAEKLWVGEGLDPYREDLQQVLDQPEESCAERLIRERRWIKGFAAAAFLASLEGRANKLFEDPDDARRFRQDLRALRTAAGVLRASNAQAESSSGTSQWARISTVAAPARWLEDTAAVPDEPASESRVAFLDALSDQLVFMDDPVGHSGIHPEALVREALSSAGDSQSSSSEGLVLRAVLLGSFASPRGIDRALLDAVPTEIPGGFVAQLLGIPEREREAWKVRIQRDAIPIAPPQPAQCWFLTAVREGTEPLDYPEADTGLWPRVLLLAIVSDESPDDDGVVLDGYSILRLRRMLSACAEIYDEETTGAVEAGGWHKTRGGHTPSRASEMLRSLPERPSTDDLRIMRRELGALFGRLDQLQASIDHLREGEPRFEERLVTAVADARPGAPWLELAIQPLRAIVDHLSRVHSRVEVITNRVKDHFSASTADETRRLLDQTEHARLVLIGAGAVTLLVAGLALYTSAAAIPEGEGFLAPNTRAAAWTLFVLAVAVAYGTLIAFVTRRPAVPTERPSGAPDRGRTWLAIGALATIGTAGSVLTLTETVAGGGLVPTIVASVAAFMLAGLLVARMLNLAPQD